MTTEKNTISKFGRSIITLFEPLQELLDTIPDTRSDSQKDGEDTRDHTNRRDVGLRILLDQLCRSCHFQLYGNIVSSTSGQKVPNLTERLRDQQNRLDEQLANYENDPVNAWAAPRTITMNHWFEVAVERVNSVQAAMRGFQEAYEYFQGEPWKAPDMANPVRKKDIDEETKKKAEALMKQHMKRKAVAAQLTA